MLTLGSLTFAAPWLLAAMAVLPILWWLLRLTPPSPRRVAFPPIRLLFLLRPKEETPHRTPWWLILLRLIIAALVVGTGQCTRVRPAWPGPARRRGRNSVAARSGHSGRRPVGAWQPARQHFPDIGASSAAVTATRIRYNGNAGRG